MAIDVEVEFRRGGRTMLGFLSYCVIAYHMEPIFAFLVGDYRVRPTSERALALFDAFCASSAPARMKSITEILPPRNVRLAREMESRRRPAFGAAEVDQVPPAAGSESAPLPERSQPPIAPAYLFDSIVGHMSSRPDNPIATPGRNFDPSLTPAENLPGGRMTSGQRGFVETVWRPRVIPMLVSAGFWRIADIP